MVYKSNFLEYWFMLTILTLFSTLLKLETFLITTFSFTPSFASTMISFFSYIVVYELLSRISSFVDWMQASAFSVFIVEV